MAIEIVTSRTHNIRVGLVAVEGHNPLDDDFMDRLDQTFGESVSSPNIVFNDSPEERESYRHIIYMFFSSLYFTYLFSLSVQSLWGEGGRDEREIESTTRSPWIILIRLSGRACLHPAFV